jgi:LysM repeat protein
MEVIKYEIKKGDTLELIAEREGISVKDLVNFHNDNCGLTNTIIGNSFPIHLKYLFLEAGVSQKIEISKISFQKKARYRCEQNNVIVIDGKPSFSSQTKTQYLLSVKKENSDNIFAVTLEDYVNSIQPEEMEPAFNLIKEIELVRNNVVFTQNEKGEINSIINLPELSDKWANFINNKSKEIPFYNEMKARAPETIEDFITNGNKEFSNETELGAVLGKNLFYHILLKANLKNDDDFRISQQSQLFPNIKLNTDVSKTLISNEENTTTYRLAGTLDKNSVNENEIIKLYQEMYQPIIKYSFTEFNFIYRITYTIQNETGFLINATASIKEQVKNNYETITKFELRRIEL